MSEEGKAFLKAAQMGQLDEAKKLLAEHPSALHARSTSKGYTALHFAAMGGAIPVVEWLILEQGFDVMVESPGKITPLADNVKLECIGVASATLPQKDMTYALDSMVRPYFVYMFALFFFYTG